MIASSSVNLNSAQVECHSLWLRTVINIASKYYFQAVTYSRTRCQVYTRPLVPISQAKAETLMEESWNAK